MPTTSPDNVYFTSGTQPESSENESSIQASSIQAALSVRQRKSFIWANDADRGTSSGMSQGDEGYQLDTKQRWEFDNGAWRLSLPYAEFSQGNKAVPANTYTAWDGLTINSSASTSTDFAIASSAGITLVNPGIYSIWIRGNASGWAQNNASFVNLTLDAAHASSEAIGNAAAGNALVSVPFLRTTAPNTILYFWVQSAVALPAFFGTIRIGRVG